MFGEGLLAKESNYCGKCGADRAYRETDRPPPGCLSFDLKALI
jgi:hypothetical protein